jgi:hypothetical protein
VPPARPFAFFVKHGPLALKLRIREDVRTLVTIFPAYAFDSKEA